MRRTAILFIVLVFLFTVGGCQTIKGWWNPDTGQTQTQQEYEQLPPEQQQNYQPATLQQINPDVVGKIDTGLNTAQGTLQVLKPLIPEPFATGAVAILGGLVGLWQTIRQRRTKDTLDQVKAGAIITAHTVDKFVRPVAELWQDFKQEQTAGKANAKKPVIMPDEASRL